MEQYTVLQQAIIAIVTMGSACGMFAIGYLYGLDAGKSQQFNKQNKPHEK